MHRQGISGLVGEFKVCGDCSRLFSSISIIFKSISSTLLCCMSVHHISASINISHARSSSYTFMGQSAHNQQDSTVASNATFDSNVICHGKFERSTEMEDFVETWFYTSISYFRMNLHRAQCCRPRLLLRTTFEEQRNMGRD